MGSSLGESHFHLDCVGRSLFFPPHEGQGLTMLLQMISGLLASNNPPLSATQIGGMAGLFSHHGFGEIIVIGTGE